MQQRFGNPQQRGLCPFKIEPNEPLTAETSVDQCSTCVCRNNPYLLSHKEDLQQIAFLTILEETPNYDPEHPSGASFITFMKAKVCIRLWREQRKLLQEIPYSHEECCGTHDEHKKNPLEAALVTQACAIEDIADSAIQQIEGEFLRQHLPELLEKLTEKEKCVIEMKFFEENSGVKIAQKLDISEGRVTQLTQSALAKLGKAYIAVLNTEQGNPYREI